MFKDLLAKHVFGYPEAFVLFQNFFMNFGRYLNLLIRSNGQSTLPHHLIGLLDIVLRPIYSFQSRSSLIRKLIEPYLIDELDAFIYQNVSIFLLCFTLAHYDLSHCLIIYMFLQTLLVVGIFASETFRWD
jgi:hypothetical protein